MRGPEVQGRPWGGRRTKLGLGLLAVTCSAAILLLVAFWLSGTHERGPDVVGFDVGRRIMDGRPVSLWLGASTPDRLVVQVSRQASTIQDADPWGFIVDAHLVTSRGVDVVAQRAISHLSDGTQLLTLVFESRAIGPSELVIGTADGTTVVLVVETPNL